MSLILPVAGICGTRKSWATCCERGMDREINRQEQEAAEHEEHREALEPAEIAGGRRRDDEAGRDDDARGLVEAEIVERQADPDEFGDDRQRVEQKEVDDAESAPEPAEPLEDQPRVADAGDRAEPQDHLLIDIEHGDEQRERPQQGEAVGLAGLPVGGERARVVVAGHHDQAGPENCKQRREAALPGVARARHRPGVWCRRRRGCGRHELRRARRPGPARRSEHSSSWVRSFRRRRLGSESADDQSAGVDTGAAATFSFDSREPAGCDRSAPTGRLGPSFKSVSSSGRERRARNGSPLLRR